MIAATFKQTYLIIKTNLNLSTMNQGEIIMYQPDESIRLEVRMEEETVWLNLNQMSLLFGRDKSVISRHIRNVYIEGELLRESTVANFATVHDENGRRVSRNIEYYNLDVIISVGYRVKSIQGTRFRQWANSVLKEYLLRGYAINQRFERLERRVTEHDAVLSEHSNKLEFFVRAALPPKEGIFYDGQIFDAYAFASELIKSARQRIVLIDNYLDESVLLMLAKRNEGVTAEIVTRQITGTQALDIDRHNRQYPPITIRESTRYHDRFLIVDDIVYHIGASLKDLGKKLFAFSKMELAAHELSVE